MTGAARRWLAHAGVGGTGVRREHSVGAWIAALHRYARIYFSETSKSLGVPEPALPYLVRLFTADDVSQDDLARFCHLDKATVARGLARLEDGGLVTRESDPQDKRIRRVRLTGKARRLEPRIRAILASWSKTITAGFSKREREVALGLLGRMAENARAAVRATDSSLREPREASATGKGDGTTVTGL